MSRRAKRPLDQDAVKVADDEIYRRHESDPRPNALYDATGKRIPLSATDPAQAGLRNEWMDLYAAKAGDDAVETVPRNPNPPGPSLHCNPPAPVPPPPHAVIKPEKKLINARWSSPTVKCGDSINMLADTQNISAGVPATYNIKKIDNSAIGTVNVPTNASSITGSWISQKQGNSWAGPEIKFTVAADGLSADSQDPQLSFHRYVNIARTPLTQDVPANGYLIRQRVMAELTDRVLIIHVPIKIRKCGQLPKRNKNESWNAWAARWNPNPYRAGTDDLTAADKTNLKNAIESIFRQKKVLHRVACARHAACPDPSNRKCCRFEIQVLVHFYDLGDATAPGISPIVNYWNDTERANAANWFATDYPGSNWIFAHEVGHLLGFYDEYTGGATDSTPGTSWQNARAFTIDNLMNGNPPQRLENYYFGYYATWIGGSTGETWETQNYI